MSEDSPKDKEQKKPSIIGRVWIMLGGDLPIIARGTPPKPGTPAHQARVPASEYRSETIILPSAAAQQAAQSEGADMTPTMQDDSLEESQEEPPDGSVSGKDEPAEARPHSAAPDAGSAMPAASESETDMVHQPRSPLAPTVGSVSFAEQELSEPLEQWLHTLDANVQSKLEAIEKQINRVGREQFKVTSLAESQLEQFQSALEMLRAADARRDAELQAVQQQVTAAQSAARLEIVQQLLPALDSIDEALRSGRAVLERSPAIPTPAHFLGRFRGQVNPHASINEDLRHAMDAWLVGLTFVRDRLLGLLAAESIQPIQAIGQPFDPSLHMVVDVVAASDTVAPGVVASEVRRGYRIGTRVLRHAEVIVAKEADTGTSAA